MRTMGWILLLAAMRAAADPAAGASPAERLAWASSLVPDLAGLSISPPPADFSRWSRRVVLWTRDPSLARDGGCRSLDLENRGTSLSTRVPTDGRPARPDAKGSFYELRLDASATLYGPTTIAPGPDGTEITSAIGGFEVLGSLGEIGPDELRYDGVPVKARVVCVESTRVDRCTDGTEQRCVRCVDHAVELESLSPHHRFGYGAHSLGSMGTDRPIACTGCPPDPKREQLPAIQAALEGQVFWTRAGSGPAFFTRRGACLAEGAAKAPEGEAR